MHEVIDLFFNYVREENIELTELLDEEEKIRKIVNQIIETKLDCGKYRFTATVKYKILIQRLEKMVTKSIKIYCRKFGL